MNVLFVDTVHPILQEAMQSWGWHCEDGTGRSREAILEALGNYHGMIIRSRFPVDETVLEAGANLKFIGRPGSGLENIDLKAAKARNIQVFNSPEGNRDAVAEHALGMLLCLFNNLLRADREVRQGSWNREPNRGMELKGKTIAIIGYGNTGHEFASRLTPFGMGVVAYDKYVHGFTSNVVRELPLEKIYQYADIVSLHVPLTEETRGMVNKEFLCRFHKNITLVNTSRGPVVNTEDLVEQLEAGKVTGACLDVLEYEGTSFEALHNAELPPAFQYLRDSDRVVLSPHIAGWTHEAYRKMSVALGNKIGQVFVENQAAGNQSPA